MARVTVEDCIEKMPNRFELVMTAAQRARKIGIGEALTVDRDNDKNTVVALREIAEETVSIEELQEDLIKSFQKILISEEDDETPEDVMDAEDAFETLMLEEEAKNEAAAESEENKTEDVQAENDTEENIS